MKAEDFIKQQIKTGYRIHFHEKVWWQETSPLFCKPVLPLQRIVPGAAKPKRFRSLLGYSHLVADEKAANKFWQVMLLSTENLSRFSISSLVSSKRARVRKGMKLNDIKKIESIDAVIGDMKKICISAAQRTGHGKPPAYYSQQSAEWESFMRREFAIHFREWWGAFHQGMLVAYFYAYLVEETMFLSAAKSQTDFLDNCPNDALLFTFLEYCRDLLECKQVIFGDWSDAPSLNKFKERYGFVKTDLPVYVQYNPAVKLIRGKFK